jgi:hypothetical protein
MLGLSWTCVIALGSSSKSCRRSCLAQRAEELDLRDPRIPGDIGLTYLALRQWKDAERAAFRALALDPHNALAASVLHRSRLNSTGDVDSARRALDGFPEAIKSPPLIARGATAFAMLELSLVGGFISTSLNDVSLMLSKLSGRRRKLGRYRTTTCDSRPTGTAMS